MLQMEPTNGSRVHAEQCSGSQGSRRWWCWLVLAHSWRHHQGDGRESLDSPPPWLCRNIFGWNTALAAERCIPVRPARPMLLQTCAALELFSVPAGAQQARHTVQASSRQAVEQPGSRHPALHPSSAPATVAIWHPPQQGRPGQDRKRLLSCAPCCHNRAA